MRAGAALTSCAFAVFGAAAIHCHPMDSLSAGDVFAGQYRLEVVLGEGGFSIVWLATEAGTNRQVALKLLKPDDGTTYSRTTRARFDREVQILATLRDPHTVKLFGHGERDGILYMVFEHLPGIDLSELLRQRGRLDPAEVIHVLRQLLCSLQEAHRAGLIHRDLKPQNVRVFASEGDLLTVRLLDFGIARGTDDSHPSVTKTGELIGTPRYMSPEQLTDRPLTPASDIYSLGMVALEMLAGPDALPDNALGSQLDRLRSGYMFAVPGGAQVEAALGAIIGRMTARSPSDRYQAAHAVLEALDRIAQPPPQTTAAALPKPPDGRKRVVAIIGGLVVVAVIVALVEDHQSEPPSIARGPGVAAQLNPLVKSPPAGLDESVTRTVEPDVGPTSEPVADVGPAPELVADVVPLAVVTGDHEPPPVVPSVGCRTGPNESGWLELGDPAESFYVPPNLDQTEPRPLVIVLHSLEAGPRESVEKMGFAELASHEGFMIAAPSNAIYSWGRIRLREVWPSGTESVVHAAYDNARRSLCVDESRVFVVGDTDGGRMLRRLQCEPWVRGIAVNAFLDFEDVSPPCDDPIPAIWILPTDSLKIPLDGSPTCPQKMRRTHSLAQLEQAFWKRNRCVGEARESFSSSDLRSSCSTWSCETPLTVCLVGGGFGWWELDVLKTFPCSEPQPGPFPRAEKIWEFFEIAVPPARSAAPD